MQCFLWEICPADAFPNTSTTPETKQKMSQQFQFLDSCSRREAGQGRCSFKTLNMNTGCGCSLHFRASALHAQRSSRVLSPEEEEEGCGGLELPAGGLDRERSVFSDSWDRCTRVCHSESRLNIHWSSHCIPAVDLSGQIDWKSCVSWKSFASRVLKHHS